MKKVYARIRRPDGTTEKMVTTWADYLTETFSPDAETLCFIPLSTHGKTYAERKQSIRETAVSLSYELAADADLDLAYSEYVSLCDFFTDAARRFGMLAELVESGIL